MRGIEALKLPIQIIRNSVHRGYGASCNLGVNGSKSDYLLFLNTDTCLSFGSLTEPLIYMERQEQGDVAILGIRLLDDSGKVNRTCARFPTVGIYFSEMFGLDKVFPDLFLNHLMKEWDHLSTREVDQVMGAYMLMRRSVFRQLDGYDERFFVYFEDLDLSLRTKQLGMKSMYLSHTYAYHKEGGTARKVRTESLFFNLRSRIQYGFKHFDLTKAIILTIGTIIFEPVSRIIFGLMRFSMIDIKTTLKAYMKLWHWLFVLLISKLSHT